MWQPLPPFRKRAKARRTPARRGQWHRPHCEPLEDRCLPSVSLAPGGPPTGLVGSPVTWTATADGHGAAPVYQFSVGPAGGASHVVRDFSLSSSFTWDPMQEGTYNVQVTVKDGFGASSGESARASYTATSRVIGTGAVVSPTSNPLVALYSAPPSPGTSMYVQFSPAGPNPSWRSTAPQPVVPGTSTNFLVAGLLPNTTYLMRDVLSDGTTSGPLTFTTGSLPANLTFPTFTVQQAPAVNSDLTQDMVYQVAPAGPPGSVLALATDLAGNVEWYYDPVANNFAGYGPSLVPGGTVLMLGGQVDNLGGGDTLREIDLAGDPLRETTVGAANAQLTALGQHSIFNFNHDALRLPNGDTAVIAGTHRTVDVNGTPTPYTGDMVLVLDQDFQVVWAWDPFQWLDTNRLPTLGEGPGDWMHSNSIAWSPADGDLVLSMRSQDWVIKIDYGNGAGDGHVVWRLGAGGDFAINSTDPSPWFSHQHDVRYINDNTLIVFDDGNTRRASDPNADSRGQVLVLNEQTMQATLVVNADLGNYSLALGGAQVLPNGNLVFTSGFQGSAPGFFGQSIEVSPDGTEDYALQMNGLEYRSYRLSTLYGGANNSYGLLDSGFEAPSQGAGGPAYQYDPAGSAWTFGGAAGLAGNGSAITGGNPGAPEGGQVAFLQGGGTISQVVRFLTAGSYRISVSAAQAGNSGAGGEAVQVLVDGTAVATFTPADTAYATYTTPSFNVTAGSHTISFVGAGPAGTDPTTLVDQVGIPLVTSPPAILVDNGQAGFSESGPGWTQFTGAGYSNTVDYVAAGSGANTASWQFTGLAAGTYDAQVTWNVVSDHAANATYSVYDGNTLLGTATVNQQQAPSGPIVTGTAFTGAPFQSLGLFQVSSGTLTVVLSDNADGYVVADAARVVPASAAPVIDSVSITPAGPHVTDTLTANVSGPGAVSYSYQWYANGNPIAGATSATLALSGHAAHGDRVTVTVTPSAAGAVSSPAVTVQDTAPVVSAVSITPARPVVTQTLTANVSGQDADGDAINYSYQWFDNGTAIPGAGGPTLDLSRTAVKPGHSITVRVTPNDGALPGSPVTSNPVSAAAPVPPTLSLSGAGRTFVGTTYTLRLTATESVPNVISGWMISWGDGTVQNVTGNPASVSHVYGTGGAIYTLSATATDQAGTYRVGGPRVEVLFPNPFQTMAALIYQAVLQRPIDAWGLAYWPATLAAGTPRATLIAALMASTEYRANLIQTLYRTYLGRPADAVGLSLGLQFLQAGGTEVQFKAALLGTPEYLRTRGGGTNGGFLAALYQDVLGRPLDPVGLANFGALLNSGASRQAVALTLLGSAEADAAFVANLYPTYFHRAPDGVGLSQLVSAMLRGFSQEQVIAAVLGTDEFIASF